MRRRYHPPAIYQRPAARYPLGQEALFDQCCLPRVRAERRVVAANDPTRFGHQPSSLQLRVERELAAAPRRPRSVDVAARRVLHDAQLGVDPIDLVPVDAARPNEAAVAEIHGLFAADGAGDGEGALELLATVPAVIGHETDAAVGAGRLERRGAVGHQRVDARRDVVEDPPTVD